MTLPLIDPPDQSFATLMSLAELPIPSTQQNEKAESRYFQSTVKAWWPVNAPGVFGGHVLGQCVVAGAKTVPDGYYMHNFHGYFILPGKQNIPFLYKVETIRDGNSYKARQIRVYQPDPEVFPDFDKFDFGNKYLCFLGLLNFKEPEAASLKHQKDLPPRLKLENLPKTIDEIPLAPDIDMPQFERWANNPDTEYDAVQHPIELRKLNMKFYNKDKPRIADRRQMHYLKSVAPLPDDVNMHIAGLLWISDRNGLFQTVNLAADEEQLIRRIASIDHTCIIHNPKTRIDKDWLAIESYSDRTTDGRGLYQGRIYDQDGSLAVSFIQDGVLRMWKTDDNDDPPRTRKKHFNL